MREYPKDEIKTPVHLGIGLEGISVGVNYSLPPNTKSFGQLRNHGQYLAITDETDRFFAELYGKATGMSGGKAGSMHLEAPESGLMATSGIVGSTISLAVGAGFAAKYNSTNDIAVAMFGDGAVEEGEFWESLNFACLHGLRVLFVCEDNDLAIHTFGSDRRGFIGKSISSGVSGFDCLVFDGDGTDVLNVIYIVRMAIEGMLRDNKPAFLNFSCFRALEHVGPNTDFHVGYRKEPTAEELKMYDPVEKYQTHLLSVGYSVDDLDGIRRKIDSDVNDSIERAKNDPYPTEEELYKGVS